MADSESHNPIVANTGQVYRRPSNAEAAERKFRMSTETGVEDFIPSKGLTTEGAHALLAIHGRNELHEEKKPKVT